MEVTRKEYDEAIVRHEEMLNRHEYGYVPDMKDPHELNAKEEEDADIDKVNEIIDTYESEQGNYWSDGTPKYIQGATS